MIAAIEMSSTESRRFWAKVRRGGVEECWLWTGATTPRGYGKLYFRGRVVYVHRLSYGLHVGAIPSGMFICHHCDTPRCCNPAHLFVGDARANSTDMHEKGRARNGHLSKPESLRRGDGHEWSKLTEAAVREILATYRPGVRGWGIESLGRRYGVTHGAIHRIVKGLAWGHVPRPPHLPAPKSEVVRIMNERRLSMLEERVAGRIE